MFRRRENAPPPPSLLERRVRSLDGEQLLEWIDRQLFDLGGSVDRWRRERDPVFISEASESLMALNALVTELGRRHVRTKKAAAREQRPSG